MDLGEIRDPYTGETVTVTAQPMTPRIPYRKANGAFADLTTNAARAAWPARGAYHLTTSNGRQYAEMHLDPDGWWLTTDTTYRPVAERKQSAWRGFVILTGAGLANGYPVRDVLVYAWRSVRPRWRRRRSAAF